MKRGFNIKIMAVGFGMCQCAFGHEVLVHQEITKNAVNAAATYSSAYSNFLGSVSSDCPVEDVNNSMIEGSAREDDKDADAGGKRSLNHFYDPLTRLGLSDSPPDIRATIGTNSFSWASVSNCPGLNYDALITKNVDTINTWSWQNARGNEWLGLTAINRSDRYIALTNMFRAVGQVIHLLQDTTQPQHVRNEQHLDQFVKGINTPWRSPIEDYGFKHRRELNYQNGMLPWRADGFTKLEDFWNRRKYDGQHGPSALVADASVDGVSGARLGLAEFSNGNFLGARHLYAEYYQSDDIKYYPFPSRNSGTDYLQKRANLASGVDTFALKNGRQSQAIYLRKTGDGVSVNHHSRFDYFGAQFPRLGMLTINDPNVLYDYHYKLIPKAVEYSAGLLDYYFRGQIGVSATLRADGKYSLVVTNQSGQDFKNGGFHVFSDTTNGVRAELTGANFDGSGYTGALAANAACNLTFTPPGDADSYLIIFQGTIGTSGGTALDPVDENIAIAAKKLKILRWRIDWPDAQNDLDLYLKDACGNLVYWYQTNSACSGTLDLDSYDDGAYDRSYENISVGNPTDGDYQVWVNYYSDENPAHNPPSTVTGTLKTYYGNEAVPISTESFTLTTTNAGVLPFPTSTTGPATLPSWYVQKRITIHNGVLTQ